MQSLLDTYQRFRTLKTNRISALPIVILMPHSACNCRCIMCDIWKDNRNLKQLSEKDLRQLLDTFKRLGTRQVVMSGGEASLHPNFFRFCEILRGVGIRVTLLTTGLTIKKNAEQLMKWVNDLIVSIDGTGPVHDLIRNLPGAFEKIREGVQHIKHSAPGYQITARTVIHKLNYRIWPSIIECAGDMGLDQISFLPADVSSHAFNREVLWSPAKQHELLLDRDELPDLKNIIESIISRFGDEIRRGFVSESPEKLMKVHQYYAAFYGLSQFPYKKCNAPWVSTVIEADGTVRPCFFHARIGNIHDESLEDVLNGERGMQFRESLDIQTDSTCKKCVCYLNLPAGASVSSNENLNR